MTATTIETIAIATTIAATTERRRAGRIALGAELARVPRVCRPLPFQPDRGQA